MKKRNAIIISSILTVLLIVISIAYFTSISSSIFQGIKTAYLDIAYESENTFRLNNLIPIKDNQIKDNAAKISFTIKNYGKTEAYAHVNLIDITINDNFKNESFKWALYQEENLIKEGDFSSIGTNTSLNLHNDIPFQPNEVKNYTIYIWISENNQDQSSMMNGSFKGKVEILGYAKPSIYRDDSGANPPKLVSGMIPVIYDETSDNWEVADTNSEWYNYGKQIWANAVTTSDETYRTAKAGTEIPMESINSMWVWIPRYKYRIEGQYGKLEDGTYGTQENPGLINVAFESGTNTTGTDSNIEVNSDYYTHPAFTFGDEKLEGIWVGKFETSGSTTTPIIKPGVVSLLGLNVKQFFETNLNFAGGIMDNNGTVTFSGNSTYGLTSSTDTHMMKNTEWGAVAYLSQSKYGKMGNPNYSSADKEIYINATYDNYVGYSTGGISLKPSGTNYFYNDRLCEEWTYNCTLEKVKGNGTGASTTGTVYGIYDMSGGGIEYVMANLVNNPLDSEFTVYPEEKYYDKIFAEYSEGAIKGHATKETRYWYQDTGDFVEKASPWFTRGGGSYSKENAGIFAFSIYNGSGDIFLSSRAILISS